MAKSNNIKQFRKPLNLNIGIIIFAVLFLYLIVTVVNYLRTTHIVRYEVEEGSLAEDNIFKGVVIREEEVQYTQAAGYVNYYAREGERVAKYGLVYIIDENGRLTADMEAASMDENSLSNEELGDFRNEIINYIHHYNSSDYESMYDCKFALKNSVLKLANMSLLQNLNGGGDAVSNNVIKYDYSPKTGIVSYWVDGYEDLKLEDINKDTFDVKTDYEKKQLFSNSLLKIGDPAYKLSTDENWSIVIPVDAERGADLATENYIKVRFLKNRYESWGKTKLFTNSAGETYLQLTFNNSMITFCQDRFLDIELIVEEEKGLKIPLTSIVQKEFFLIPEDFVIAGGNNGGYSVLRQCYLEDGTISSQRLELDVYNYDSEGHEYYLDSSILNPGDVLYKLDGQETYTVSKRATLIGVYNMNKGYADFKQINILYQNDEYAIVKSNTKYGLNVYDYIVLDANSIKDDEFIK